MRDVCCRNVVSDVHVKVKLQITPSKESTESARYEVAGCAPGLGPSASYAARLVAQTGSIRLKVQYNQHMQRKRFRLHYL